MIPLPADLSCPAPTPDSPVVVEVAAAGEFPADWSVVEGSGRTGPTILPLLVGIVRHPDGTILVDSGLGLTTRSHRWPRFPLNGLAVSSPDGTAVVERVPHPIKVLLTHNHYDHVGGLFDLPGVEVWAGLDDTRGSALPPDLRTIVRVVGQDLRDGQVGRVLGVPGKDVQGDGTVWYLATPGHTRGSSSVLVRAKDAAYLFIGDTAWVDSHLADKRRPGWVSFFIDEDRAALDRSLEWARWIHSNCPNVHVVAGHEARWAQGAK